MTDDTAPEIAYETQGVTLWRGDCIEVMRDLPDESVHAVVTDPPYGLDFMGKRWDSPRMLGQLATGLEQRGAFAYGGTHSRGYAEHDGAAFQRWVEVWATEALRVLKPGGHLLAFGGSRTWHRLAAGIEDAGFEIRDSIAWLYGSGFPKSLDVSKAIDKAAGAECAKVRKAGAASAYSANAGNDRPWMQRARDEGGIEVDGDTPATPEAAAWQGWGTALKPAFEPIVVARKPLAGTVAANVLEFGTGALNIDASRIGDEVREKQRGTGVAVSGNSSMSGHNTQREIVGHVTGRWPTNVVLDESQAKSLDNQTGVLTSGRLTPGMTDRGKSAGVLGDYAGRPIEREFGGDSGGASRFFPTFRYEAKAPTHERPVDGETAHPTVKPLDLMRWLVRLVTPPSGVVLEPFAGSGTTLEAAVLEGFDVIGIERDPEYLPLIRRRLAKPMQQSLFGDWEEGA